MNHKRLERGDVSVQDGPDGMVSVSDGTNTVALTADEAYWLFFVAGPAVMPDVPSGPESTKHHRGRNRSRA